MQICKPDIALLDKDDKVDLRQRHCNSMKIIRLHAYKLGFLIFLNVTRYKRKYCIQTL